MKSIKTKLPVIRRALSNLGKKLDDGDDSELLVWVIPSALACAHRPLRHHPRFGGRGRDLPPEASGAIHSWARRMREYGIRSLICLMHPKEVLHYAELDLDGENLIGFYRKAGFAVRHIPWEDPAHRSSGERRSFPDECARVSEEALAAFDALKKPVLLHCSAGIDRSSPIAAFIFTRRAHRL
jgi:hypothetical protein